MQWSAFLDALVASSEHHVLLMENDAVRVLETRIEVGETTALHTHEWPGTTYFLSCSDMVRRGEDGLVQFDSREHPPRAVGQAVWTPVLGPHTLENVGDQAIHVITVEVKGAK